MSFIVFGDDGLIKKVHVVQTWFKSVYGVFGLRVVTNLCLFGYDSSTSTTRHFERLWLRLVINFQFFGLRLLAYTFGVAVYDS